MKQSSLWSNRAFVLARPPSEKNACNRYNTAKTVRDAIHIYVLCIYMLDTLGVLRSEWYSDWLYG